MKLQFYIKAVLTNIFAFLIIITILRFAIGQNSGINFANSIGASFILGLGILVLAIIHAEIIDRLSPSKNKDKYKTKQIREINLNIDASKTFEVCMNFIVREKCKIKTEDKEKKLIVAKTPYSLLSWGDKIKFEISQNNDNSSRVAITVYPILSAAMIDLGKNFKMSERALEFINKNSLQQFSDK